VAHDPAFGLEIGRVEQLDDDEAPLVAGLAFDAVESGQAARAWPASTSASCPARC